MTREEIIRMAREASNTPIDHHATPDLFGVSQLERFAALVAAHERELCAKVCETAEVPIDIDVWMGTKKELTAATALGIAAAIRARSK